MRLTEGRWGLLVVICFAVLSPAIADRSASAQSPGRQANLPQPSIPQNLPAPRPPQAIPRFVVVLDPAHGGGDRGAQLGPQLEEKDLVLALSTRLRSVLVAHGIEVTTTRDTDATLLPANRAAAANASHASACLSLHATTSGSGVHLFTSSLAPAPAAMFLPWNAAQAPSIEQSLKLSSEINSAMTHAEIPVTLGRTSLQPLNNFTCPAVALEIAPLSRAAGKVAQLSDAAYQQRVIAAVASAMDAWQRDWLVQP